MQALLPAESALRAKQSSALGIRDAHTASAISPEALGPPPHRALATARRLRCPLPIDARARNRGGDRGPPTRGGSARHRISLRERSRRRTRPRLDTPTRLGRGAAALDRWTVAVDDSGADALADTSDGRFARLAAGRRVGGLAPVALLALLKHPLARSRRRIEALSARYRGRSKGHPARPAAAEGIARDRARARRVRDELES